MNSEANVDIVWSEIEWNDIKTFLSSGRFFWASRTLKNVIKFLIDFKCSCFFFAPELNSSPHFHENFSTNNSQLKNSSVKMNWISNLVNSAFNLTPFFCFNVHAIQFSVLCLLLRNNFLLFIKNKNEIKNERISVCTGVVWVGCF